MRVAFYESERDNQPACVDVTWEELVETLRSIEHTPCAPCAGKTCPHKYGAAWSPVDIEGTRHNDNVAAVTLAVFDLDHLTGAQLAAVARNIDGLQYVIHTTHSHGRNVHVGGTQEDNCLRLVVPLSRPVLAGEWRAFLASAIDHLKLPADRACKDLSRLYFLPTAPAGAEAWSEVGEGRALDVGALLGAAEVHAARGTSRDLPSPAAPPEALDFGALRARVGALRYKYSRGTDVEALEKYELLAAVMDGTPLAEPGNRDNGIHQALSIIACALPAHTPWEAAEALVQPSIAAMDVEPEGLPFWLARAKFSYDRSMESRVERDAEKKRKDASIRERIRAVLMGPRRDPNETPPDDDPPGGGPVLRDGDVGLGSDAPEPGGHDVAGGRRSLVPQHLLDAAAESAVNLDETEPDPDHVPLFTDEQLAADPEIWREALLWTDKGIRQCGANVYAVLVNAPAVRGTIRFNEVSKAIEVHGGPFADVPSSVLDVEVSNWLQRSVGLFLSTGEIAQQVARVARLRSFDPLRDWLLGLTWDGTPRADRFLQYLGADATMPERYIGTIGPKWLMSAVARALDPGCQVDTVLVLEGAQGIRKSSAFRVLGGGFFCDTQIVLGDKDSRMLAACSWIIELAELAVFRRSELETQKAFFTSKADKFRPPYARAIEEFPRRCVFVGTTNEDSYLHDTTGNRRYWPVAVGTIDIDALARDREQLWAEAVVRFFAGVTWRAESGHESSCECAPCRGHRWWISEGEAVDIGAAGVAGDRVDESPMQARIGDWWYAQHPVKRPEYVRAHDVAEAALQFTPDRVNRGVIMEIGAALKALGFKKERRLVGNINARVFVATESMRQHPQGISNHLRSIAQSTATRRQP